MSLHTHLTQIHESVSGLVKPANLQGFLNHVSGFNFNSLPRATEDAIPASLLHLDQMLMYHNMNFTNHTGQLLLSGTSGLAHTTLMHLTILNIFLVVFDELEQKHKNQWRNHLSIAQAKSFSRFKLIVANIQRFINSNGTSASIVFANMDANLLKKNISSVTKIDSFLNHFWQWNMHCWTPIQGRGAQYYIKELDDDALEEKNEWTASRLCIVCSKNYFQYSKNCWLFIHVYLKHISQSIALYDQTKHSSKWNYQPE